MDCQTCGIALDDDGTCPTCSNFQDNNDTAERTQSRVLMSIVRSVCASNCHWTEVEDAVSQAKEVGLTGEEIESAIRDYRFRYEDPIVALSEDQSRLLAQLTDRGLVIDRCESGPFRQGFTVFKPTRVPGNSRPGGGSSVVSLDKEGDFDEDGDTSDAPIAWLYPETANSWVFLISAYSGGVGPGDYFKRHNGLEPTVDDVIDYYFGDPKRMTPQVCLDRQERLGGTQNHSLTRFRT